MEDTDVIARATGGQALCAIMVGGADNEGRGRDLKQVLKQPQTCKLRGAVQECRTYSRVFSSEEEGLTFLETLAKSKWTAAMYAGGLGIGKGSIEAGRDKVHETNSTATQKSTSVCKIACWYFPTASFNIPRHEMQLSEEALDHARRVQTRDDAVRFLETFGSHVSSGNYHLGGLLTKVVTIKTNQATSLEVLKDSANSNLQAGLKMRIFGYTGGAKVVHLKDKASSSQDKGTTQEARMESTLVTVGPNIADENEFKAQLDKDRSTWRIIDMPINGGADDLVPVWEIVSFANNGAAVLEKVPNLLRDAWCSHITNSRGALNNVTVRDLYFQTTTGRITTGSSGLQEETLKSRLIRANNATKPPPSPIEVMQTLTNAWNEATSTGVGEDMHNLVRLFNLQEFTSLLQSIAQSTASEMEPAKKLVRRLINGDVQCALHMAGSHLPQGVENLLAEHASSDQSRDRDTVSTSGLGPLLHVERIAPAELPHSLENILRKTNLEEAPDKPLGFFVARAVRACLIEEAATNEANAKMVVRSVVMTYNFDDNGFYGYEPSRLTIPVVERMIQDLKLSLSTDAHTSAVPTISTEDQPHPTSRDDLSQTGRRPSSPLVQGVMSRREIEAVAPSLTARATGKLLKFEKPAEKPALRDMVSTYDNDVLIDRPFITTDPGKRMLDCLRHRMEPFASAVTYSNAELAADDEEEENRDSNSDGYCSDGSDDSKSSDCNRGPSPFEQLVQLLMPSDVLRQIALFQLLLEQRFSVPIVVPAHYRDLKSAWAQEIVESAWSQQIDATRFLHLGEALGHVHVKLAHQKILHIGQDTNLPRVVFVSNREDPTRCETSEMAREVMNCEFVSKHREGHTSNGPVVELGVGFVARPAIRRPADDDELISHDKHMPCLVLCVWGDHTQLESFLKEVANMVVVEMDPDGKPSPIPWITEQNTNLDPVLYWKIDVAKKGKKVKPTDYKQTWGSFKELTASIGGYLVRKLEGFGAGQNIGGNKADRATSTLQECLDKCMGPLNQKTEVICMDGIGVDGIAEARKSFLLQSSFAREARYYFKQLRARGEEKKVRMKKIQEERDGRANKASQVTKLPILEHFIQLLSEKDHVKRNVSILSFELLINEKLQSTLKAAADEVNAAFKASQNNPEHTGLKNEYNRRRQIHLDQTLGLEHLWRELSHIFTADPSRKDLPVLAARHLLDGFPLEVLDGDAPIFQKLWVDTVLVELEKNLRSVLGPKPRVFVLSVLGIQSSGKSTLLNLMFGTRFRTSAGMCTRGVYLQLVKSDWPGYDYLLVLDTEGLRAPEFFGLEDSELKDNRLATFALLPANACIIMVTNEEDNGLKEVIPMVMLAYKGSTMAEKYGGMRAKLFFVYRSVDINDKQNLERNEQNLRGHLTKAASDIASVQICGTGQQSTPQAKSSRSIKFPVDEVEVKYLGSLKRGNVPPLDVPDWEYGTNVVDLRNCIHKRASKGIHCESGLKEWSDYLGMVVECINHSNFEHRFPDLIEYQNYNDLHAKLASCRQNVGKKYLETFEFLQRKVEQEKCTDSEHQKSLWISDLESRMKETIKKETNEVYTILERKQYRSWKLQAKTDWDSFLEEKNRYWRACVADLIDGVANFENKIGECYQKVQKQIEADAENYKTNFTQDDKMENHFKSLFEGILEAAKEEFSPMETRVKGKVIDVYRKYSIVGEMYNFPDAGMTVPDKPRIPVLPWQWTSLISTKFNDGRETQLSEVTKQLVDRMERHLASSKHYADHVVEEVIMFTEQAIAENEIKRDQKQQLHENVMGALIRTLKSIQSAYDKDHNVARRLETERGRFWTFFKNCANRVGGTQMLKEDVEKVLKKNLVGGFKTELRNHVCNKLQSEAWVCNARVLRAHLELYLVNLIENGEIDKLLGCVADGTWHYDLLMNKLTAEEITRQIEEEEHWKSFVHHVEQSLHVANIFSQTALDASHKSTYFLKKLENELRSRAKSSVLAQDISGLSPDVYAKYSKDIDFDTVTDYLCKEVHGTQLPRPWSDNDIAETVRLVRERMVQCATDCARPRCNEACPGCSLTCFNSVGHTGKHAAAHQPQGLNGWYGTQTYELCPGSCCYYFQAKSFFRSQRFTNNEFVKYEDWEKYFPSWQVPAANISKVELREYIFAYYQPEIQKVYSRKDFKTKICPKIPPEYKDHTLKGLKCEFENIISRHI